MKNQDDNSLNVNEISNLLHEFWQRTSDSCPLEASKAEEEEIQFKKFVEEKIEDMSSESAFSFSMKYLAETYHPHTLAIVDADSVQILEGIKTIHDDQYIVD